MSVYVGFKVGKAKKHKAYVSEYYCGGCGWPVSDHDSYCPECGGAFREEDATERTCEGYRCEEEDGATMTLNDVDTNGRYCPINGFNPPCGLCMFAIESESGSVACAVSVMALVNDSLHVKNVIHPINERQ